VIQLLGVPFHGCGPRVGSALGPASLRLQNLQGALESLGLEVGDNGDVPFDIVQDGGEIRNFGTVSNVLGGLKPRVAQILAAGHTPMVLGGDHSLSIGSISAALDHTDCAVLWIDAHADINTPETSPSGNLHGMPLACLMDFPSESLQWQQLQSALVTSPLRSNRMAWIGLRDVDPGEAATITGLDGCFATTMQDVDRVGVPRLVEAFIAWFKQSGAKKLWISFDVDSLDPVLAPGTGTVVRGGFTYREAHLIAEMLSENLRDQLLGLDVVEVNPILDSRNETAQATIEWLCSLFGKTILPGWKQNGL